MAARKQQAEERRVYVTIRSGKSREKLETWRYWEIVGALQWMHLGRDEAYSAAKWCAKAKPGDSMAFSNGVRMEVSSE